MGRRSDIDWEKIQRQYRLAKKTDDEIAATNGISRSALARRVKKEGWSKDLSEQVKLETKAKVSAAIVKKATAKLLQSHKKDSNAVEVEAISNALLIAEHEKVGTKGRELFEKILDKIAEQVDATPSIEAVAKMVEADDPAALPALRKVLSLPSYVDSAKKATEGAAKAIDVERKARNLDDAPPPGDEEVREVTVTII